MQNSFDQTKTIVLKFGGTSVGNFIHNITTIVCSYLNTTHKVIVVCSAISAKSKESGTTSQLMSICRNVLVDLELCEGLVDSIFKTHEHLGKHSKGLSFKLKLIKDHLLEYIKAINIVGEVSEEMKDKILSYGEYLSCVLIQENMAHAKVNSCICNISRVLKKEDDPSNDICFYKRLIDEIKDLISEKLKTRDVLIVGGFFGEVKGGLINLVGRGYSDFTGCLIACGTGGGYIIYKEVDGIFTCDPNLVKSAKLVHSLSYDEAMELTLFGAQVVHPLCISLLRLHDVFLYVKNVKETNQKHTLVSNYPENTVQNKKRGNLLTIKRDISIVDIKLKKSFNMAASFRKIFELMDKVKLDIDLISTTESNISLATNTQNLEKNMAFIKDSVKGYAELDIPEENLSIISLIGQNMKRSIGVASELFQIYKDLGITIKMISQGASEINISCVIDQEKSVRALQEIHKRMIE